MTTKTIALTTDWITICTSGHTVDGREIAESTIREMAETYDPAHYTANINFNHENWYGTFGTVSELTTRESEYGLQLLAKFNVNEKTLNTCKNIDLYSSVEIMPDFRKTGQAYLCGLAMTPTPASAATDALKFNATQTPAPTPNHFTSNTPTRLNVDDTDDKKISSIYNMLKQIVAPTKNNTEKKTMEHKIYPGFGTIHHLERCRREAAALAAAPEQETNAQTEPQTEPQINELATKLAQIENVVASYQQQIDSLSNMITNAISESPTAPAATATEFTAKTDENLDFLA